jgi:hypothetical protein
MEFVELYGRFQRVSRGSQLAGKNESKEIDFKLPARNYTIPQKNVSTQTKKKKTAISSLFTLKY